MSRLLLPMLEWLGRLRLFGSVSSKPTFQVGDPNAADSLGTLEWKSYLDAERLYSVWGPHPASPWVPFHCVTLFAAVEPRMRLMGESSVVGPAPAEGLPAWIDLDAPPPAWLTAEVWTVVDLPGSWSAAVGAMLVPAVQPVCTFDNWPAGSGAIRTELTLAALLYYAARVRSKRLAADSDAPPAWLCDRARFSVPRPGPGRYDNRYFLDDRLMPGVGTLKQAGIRRIIYLTPTRADAISSDLGRHFVEFEKQGFEMRHASVEDRASFDELRPLSIDPLAKFDASALNFMRSSAGGFGGFVPQPSSGG